MRGDPRRMPEAPSLGQTSQPPENPANPCPPKFKWWRAAQNPKETTRYQTFIDQILFTDEGTNLFRPTTLFTAPNALVAAMVDGDSDTLLTALHVVWDGRGTARVQGVATARNARERGLGHSLLSYTLALLRDLGTIHVELAVRVDDHGQVYTPAYRLYRRVGFIDAYDFQGTVSGGTADAHLGSPGSQFTARIMRVNLGQEQSP